MKDSYNPNAMGMSNADLEYAKEEFDKAKRRLTIKLDATQAQATHISGNGSPMKKADTIFRLGQYKRELEEFEKLVDDWLLYQEAMKVRSKSKKEIMV